ncbi:MAG: replicative DNA helicase [Oscillospiraceae bacterium]|jgi:replicative DNA helicase|nr:replicative DNA helicase [Oscillospiraceae bacterium]
MAGLNISDVNLPYSLDAEQTVLGTIILDSSAITDVADILKPDHFHVGLHNELFGVMYGMFISNAPIDLVTVIENSVRRGVFDNQDEARAYLLKLAESVVNPSGIKNYARIIEEKHMIRELIYVCRDIFDMAGGGLEEPRRIMDFAEKQIYELRAGRELSGLKHIKPLIDDKINELREICADPDGKKNAALSSSFHDLDRYIFGLNPSDLILIAGRPSMGKTSFAVNIATGAAKLRPEKKVVIFSLEMSREQLVSRIIATESRVTTDQMRNGLIDGDGWRNIANAAETLSKLEIYIDDSSTVSIGEMKAKLRRIKNLGLVVIDYLQLMSTGRTDGNRVQEVSEITRNLKLMAKDLNVPVIVASQLSRGPDSRQDKRPMLSDLRESGSIEQDADIVIFLYRDFYYHKESEKPYLCECVIAKNRQGETGTVELHWDERYTKFSTLDYKYE